MSRVTQERIQNQQGILWLVNATGAYQSMECYSGESRKSDCKRIRRKNIQINWGKLKQGSKILVGIYIDCFIHKCGFKNNKDQKSGGIM